MGRWNSCEIYVKILHSSILRTKDRAKRITLFHMPLQVGIFQTRTFHMRVKGTCETNVKTYENVWNGSIICDNKHLCTSLSWRLSLILKDHFIACSLHWSLNGRYVYAFRSFADVCIWYWLKGPERTYRLLPPAEFSFARWGSHSSDSRWNHSSFLFCSMSSS